MRHLPRLFTLLLSLLITTTFWAAAQAEAKGKGDTMEQFKETLVRQEAAWRDFVAHAEVSQDMKLVLPDKRLYSPEDKARVFFHAPAGAGKRATVILRKNYAEILQMDRELTQAGDGMVELPALEVGSYEVLLRTGAGQEARASFDVGQFTLSPLVVEIKSREFKDSNLAIEALVTVLGEPYEGKLTAALKCGACNWALIKSVEETVRAGRLSVKIDISGHSGPYELAISTPTGLTASSILHGTSAQDMDESLIGQAGRDYMASLFPRPGATEHRGLYLREANYTTGAFESKELIASRPTVTVLKDLSLVTVFIIDPWAKTIDVKSYAEGVNKSGRLEFEVKSPFIHVSGAGLDKSGEVQRFFMTYFRPLEGYGLGAPEAVAGGSKLKVMLKAPRGTRVLLSLIDQRLDQDKAANKAATPQMRALENFSTEHARITAPPVDRRALGAGAERMAEASPSEAMPFTAPPPSMPKKSMAPPAPASPSPAGAPEAQEAPPAESIKDKLRVLAYEVVEVGEGTSEWSFALPEGEGVYRLTAYYFKGYDYKEFAQVIRASAEYALEVDSPAFLFEGELAEVGVNYKALKEAQLILRKGGLEVLSKKIKGAGVERLGIKGPGAFVAELRDAQGKVLKAAGFEVMEPGKARLQVSSVELMGKGQETKGIITVYPSPIFLASEVAEGLLVYPFGCAEQTSSKLSGLAVLYRASEKGVIPQDVEKIRTYIRAGLSRMKALFFHGERGFALWEQGQPDPRVTLTVLQNLRPFMRLLKEFPEARPLIDGALASLRNARVTDNSLLPYGAEFGGGGKGAGLAGQVYALQHIAREGKDSAGIKELTEGIASQARTEGNFVYWEGAGFWGGNLQSTCEALRALVLAGDLGLIKKGFGYVGREMISGRLRTTADTRAFIELLTDMASVESVRAEIDGREVLVKRPELGSIVTTLTDNTLVKHTSERVVDYTESSSDFPFKVETSASAASVGDRVTIKIIPLAKSDGESMPVPVARIYLPPNLAFLKAGGNIQGLYEPIARGELIIETVAVRKGAGSLLVIVHDMYKTDRVGISPRIGFTVK